MTRSCFPHEISVQMDWQHPCRLIDTLPAGQEWCGGELMKVWLKENLSNSDDDKLGYT